MALDVSQLELLNQMWQWANNLLTPEELSNMFLTKTKYERTAWNMASERGRIELLNKLWDLAEKLLSPGNGIACS